MNEKIFCQNWRLETFATLYCLFRRKIAEIFDPPFSHSTYVRDEFRTSGMSFIKDIDHPGDQDQFNTILVLQIYIWEAWGYRRSYKLGQALRDWQHRLYIHYSHFSKMGLALVFFWRSINITVAVQSKCERKDFLKVESKIKF